MPKNLEIEFLEFLEPKDGVPRELDITDFLMKNFPTPNLHDLTAAYHDTDAIRFLMSSKNTGYFFFYEDFLNPIYNKFIFSEKGVDRRHWFDSMEPKMHAKIEYAGTKYLYEYRTSEILRLTNKSIIKTNNAIKKNSERQTTILWYTVLVAALSFGISAINLVINWPKKDQTPYQILIINKSDIPLSQKQMPKVSPKSDTSFPKEAKKTLPKKVGG